MTETSNLIITNARIWDGKKLLTDDTVVIEAGKIAAIGDSALVTKYAHSAANDASGVRIIDAAGALLTPGFVDAHNHTAMGGVERNRCDLTDCDNQEQALAKIKEYAENNPEQKWILGGGWRMPWFAGGTPTRQLLDEIVPERPVYLINADHHGAWVNSLALELAGITAATADPQDGRIERENDGHPNGTLQEGATSLIESALPDFTEAEIAAGIASGEQYLFSCGVTGWQEAILGSYGGYPDVSPVYAKQVDAGLITGRATGALWVSRDFDGLSIADFVKDLERRKALYERAGFNLQHVKIMVDGVQENGTAALTEPYIQTPECECAPNTGIAYFSREDLLELVPLLNAAGFDAHMHAIGDRAVRWALDAVAAVPAEVRAARHNHIAHLHVVDPQDIPRFAQLNVYANVQALWACQDQQMLELTFPTLGSERVKWQYPFGSLAAAGAQLVAGSDWPVSTPDPWQAIHVAVNRTEPGAEPGEPLNEAEALSLEQILAAYTEGSAKLLRVSTGTIEVGAVADLALADRDPFSADKTLLWQTKNKLTVVGGKVVYERA